MNDNNSKNDKLLNEIPLRQKRRSTLFDGMLNNCRSHILEQYHKNDTVAYRCSYGDKNYDVVSLEKAKIYHDEHLSEDTLSLPV